MKLRTLLSLATAFIGLLSGAGAAQAQNWTVELNAAKAEGQSGMELGLGYNFRAGRFRLTPVVGGLIYQGENNRYYVDHMSNGDRCRDSQTGRFADSNKCNNGELDAYGKLEAGVRFAEKWDIGAGVRLGDDTKPYGTLSYDFGAAGSLKLFGGEDYYGAGVHLRF